MSALNASVKGFIRIHFILVNKNGSIFFSAWIGFLFNCLIERIALYSRLRLGLYQLLHNRPTAMRHA